MIVILKEHFECSNKCTVKRHDEETENESFEGDDFEAYIFNFLSDIIHSFSDTCASSYLTYFDVLVLHFNQSLQPTRTISDRQCTLCVFDSAIQFTGAHSCHYSQYFPSRMEEKLTLQVK